MATNDTIKPFKISIPDSQIAALRQKLALATFPDEIGQPWDLGASLDDVKRLTAYWKDSFDWRKAERELNESLPQYVTTVPVAGFEDIDIHFVHQKSQSQGGRKAIPLLFLHGWPGSFLEVKKALPLLAQASEDQPTFDVVAPSLPNFGFSGGVSKKGFGLAQYAESVHAVMTRLGYTEYVVQGGDWGSAIARTLAILYPTHVKAIHLNFILAFPPSPWRNPIIFLQALLAYILPPFSQTNKRRIAATRNYLEEHSGYLKQQDTFPQTLGYALHDSPVGLLAWMYDRLHFWTDGYPWADDEILLWISIYAFSRAGPAASLRIYRETSHQPHFEEGIDITWLSRDTIISSPTPDSVKVAVANFPKEIIQIPSTWLKATGNVVHESEFSMGGHFAAWETPGLLVQDLQAFIGKSGIIDKD